MKTTFTALMICVVLTLNNYAQDVPHTVLEGHWDSVHSVSFSPDGSTIASGSTDETIRLWNTNTGTHLRTLIGHTDSVSGHV